MTDKPSVGDQPVHPQSLNAEGPFGGASLFQEAAMRALGNPEICTGTAHEFYLKRWFGDRTGIESGEIAAKQACEAADALMAEWERRGGGS